MALYAETRPEILADDAAASQGALKWLWLCHIGDFANSTKEKTMFVHQFRFSFKDESTEEQRAEVLAVLRKIASADSVSFSAVGQNLGDPAEGLTHAYCAGFEDLAAFERYLYDPAHLEGDPHIVPHFKKLAIGPELSDDMDPDLSEKIAAMHQRKMTKYPEWGGLMATVPELRFV
jgi:hypothetical protein